MAPRGEVSPSSRSRLARAQLSSRSRVKMPTAASGVVGIAFVVARKHDGRVGAALVAVRECRVGALERLGGGDLREGSTADVRQPSRLTGAAVEVMAQGPLGGRMRPEMPITACESVPWSTSTDEFGDQSES